MKEIGGLEQFDPNPRVSDGGIVGAAGKVTNIEEGRAKLARNGVILTATRLAQVYDFSVLGEAPPDNVNPQKFREMKAQYRNAVVAFVSNCADLFQDPDVAAAFVGFGQESWMSSFPGSKTSLNVFTFFRHGPSNDPPVIERIAVDLRLNEADGAGELFLSLEHGQSGRDVYRRQVKEFHEDRFRRAISEEFPSGKWEIKCAVAARQPNPVVGFFPTDSNIVNFYGAAKKPFEPADFVAHPILFEAFIKGFGQRAEKVLADYVRPNTTTSEDAKRLTGLIGSFDDHNIALSEALAQYREGKVK